MTHACSFTVSKALSMMGNKVQAGASLIIDRYSYSREAFSSVRGIGVECCKASEVGLLAPDLVLYLDIPPETIDACQATEDVEKQLQEIVLDLVITCQKRKPLSLL